MSPRRRIQTDVPETEDPDGCLGDGGSRRMSLRRRIQTDVPETEDPDGCPRDGGSRRMSPRRRIQTDVPETEDPDRSLRDGRPGRTGTENVPEMEGQDGWAHPSWLSVSGTSMCAICLGLTFGDGCHRRMSLRRMTETEGHDGCNRQMSPRPKDGGKVCVCLCVSTCVFYCLSVCLSVCRWVGRSVFYCDVVYIMSFDFIQSISLLSCYLFTSSSSSLLRWPQSS